MAEILDRRLLDELAGGNRRIREGLEALLSTVTDTSNAQSVNIAATQSMNDAAVIVLSANEAFANERILAVGRGLSLSEDGTNVIVAFAEGPVTSTGGFAVKFIASGDSAVVMPLTGTLATTGNPETLSNKTLSSPALTGLGDYADDAAAATGGVLVGGMYRTGSTLKVRVA